MKYGLNKTPSMTLFFFFLALLAISLPAHPGLYFHHGFNYHSTSDNADDFSYTTMRNIVFVGATLGKADRFILGQNAIFWNKTHTGSTGANESTLSLMELGPRVTYYFNEARELYVSFAWHPYVKGTRTLSTGSTEEEISGTSLYLGAGLQFKINKSFFLGAALNYHSISISSATVDTAETEVNHSYSYIFPTIEISFRFR